MAVRTAAPYGMGARQYNLHAQDQGCASARGGAPRPCSPTISSFASLIAGGSCPSAVALQWQECANSGHPRWRGEWIKSKERLARFGENQRCLNHWARTQRAFAASANLASVAFRSGTAQRSRSLEAAVACRESFKEKL
jgi:hypothetical protein